MLRYAESRLLAPLMAFGMAGPWLWRWWWGGRQARLVAGPMQEMDISVNGGYRPKVVIAQQGIPLRLNFDRQEDNPCSDWVIFSEPRIKCMLPAFKSTSVTFTPDRAGEFMFTCQYGMYVGRLVVK